MDHSVRNVETGFNSNNSGNNRDENFSYPVPAKIGFFKSIGIKIKDFLKFLVVGESEALSKILNKAVVVLLFAGIVSGFATYWALTESEAFAGNPDAVIWLLNVDLVILLVLAVLLARRLVGVYNNWRQGLAGSKLQIRLVYLFSLLAVTPAILMAILSAFLFHFGIQSWFSGQVRTAVEESQAVATAYLNEHVQVIKADALAMANDLGRQATILLQNRDALEKVLRTQSFLRDLSEAVVFDGQGKILASSGFTFALEFESVPEYALLEANSGEVSVMRGASDDRVRGLVKLDNFMDTYLYVGRMLDPKVVSHVDRTREATEYYMKLEGKRTDLQVAFIMIYLVVAFLLLIVAIWFGLVFARKLVAPISSIVSAAERMRAGDMTARVPENHDLEEFDYLSRSFNRMTTQLQQHQNELLNANRQIDERRRFIETVLAGVSSGIVGVDQDGRILLANNSAADVFGVDKSSILQKPVSEIIPGVDEMLKEAYARPQKILEQQMRYHAPDNNQKTLLVRIAVEKIDEREYNAVITFDDISELLVAQRKAAWADVARRIAHEIKNPLTPIQLSAERLQRKYLSQITTEQETFKKCIGTIIRHVGDIGHMVNEFSSFARMPQPQLKQENVTSIIKEVLILQEEAHKDIHFNKIGLDVKADALFVMCDSQQIRQALTNIIQNAIDSVQARMTRDKAAHGHAEPGHIDVMLATNEKDEAMISVTDNGLGFPKGEDVSRLMEPYVTMREKGTGLGLAIVKKIMDDHKGSLVLGVFEDLKKTDGWRNMKGASVTLVMPLTQSSGRLEAGAESDDELYDQPKKVANDK